MCWATPSSTGICRRSNFREVGSGAAKREAREKLLEAARRREIDVVLVWRLDRWGRSVTDLLATLQELEHLGVGFVSLTEALDLTTPAGRAMAGLLAIFAEFEREILRERTRAGLAHARENGKRLGRAATAAVHAAEIRKLHRAGVSKAHQALYLRFYGNYLIQITTPSTADPWTTLNSIGPLPSLAGFVMDWNASPVIATSGYTLNLYTESTPIIFQAVLTAGVPCAGSQSGNVADMQAVINEALGIAPAEADMNGDGVVNVVDVQLVTNAVLGCGVTPASFGVRTVAYPVGRKG